MLGSSVNYLMNVICFCINYFLGRAGKKRIGNSHSSRSRTLRNERSEWLLTGVWF